MKNKELNNEKRLYYVAQEVVQDGEWSHIYMFIVGTRLEAEKNLERLKEYLLGEECKKLHNIKKTELKDGWYEEIDNICGEYEVKLEKRDK